MKWENVGTGDLVAKFDALPHYYLNGLRKPTRLPRQCVTAGI
jgi:hypothetical protein